MKKWIRPTNSPIWRVLLEVKKYPNLISKVGLIADKIFENPRDLLWKQIKLYNRNVKSVLLYGAECLRTVETKINQLNVFHNRCLRQICNIYKANKISNYELYAKTECYSMATEGQKWPRGKSLRETLKRWNRHLERQREKQKREFHGEIGMAALSLMDRCNERRRQSIINTWTSVCQF